MATITATLGPTMVGAAVVKTQKSGRVSVNISKTNSDIGFIASQLSGIKISTTHVLKKSPLPISSPLRHSLPPVARRVCPFTGKRSNKANKVSHSNHKTTKREFVNLQYKRIWWEAGKHHVKLRLSTKAMKTIEKNGMDAVADKAGIDLSKM